RRGRRVPLADRRTGMTAEVAATSTSIAASRPWRAVFAVPAVAALLAGLDGALSLLGVWSPVPGDRTADAHGSLMTLVFLGTLIALERAVAHLLSSAYTRPPFRSQRAR